MTVERLVAAAIMRDGKMLERGFQSHSELRAALNPEMMSPNRHVEGDIDGFVTSAGRFVDRLDARDVAITSGQIGPMWKDATRDLLSSDVNW